MRAQVEVRLGTALTPAQVRAAGFDAVVLATGARPARNGYQRALPDRDALPGVEADNVFDVRDVLDGGAALGARVLLLDDCGGGWPAMGTALHIAERGHKLAIATRDGMLAAGLVRTKAEGAIRKRLAKAGAEALTDTAVLAWEGTAARLRSLLDGREWAREFDSLVLATAALPEDELGRALGTDADLEVHAIGDCVAPRRASTAIYEARRLAREL